MSIAINIVARNEEQRLAFLLPILSKYIDEIVIIDQSSVDDTAKVAKDYGLVIKDKAWGYCEPSRELAMANTKSDWILVLDADEFLVDRFVELLKEYTSVPDYIDGYIMHRATTILDDIEIGAWPMKDILGFGHDCKLEHISYPRLYRLFRNGRVIFPLKAHEMIGIPHNGIVKSLFYNAIIDVKTRQEEKINDIRYNALWKGTFDPKIHL